MRDMLDEPTGDACDGRLVLLEYIPPETGS
jgi:hypothetical protein